MKISAAFPAGVAALLFETARRRRSLEGRIVGELEAAGYSEVILPILDYLEPYGDLLPASTLAERYRFVDRDGELIALRSDFTPMLARLLAPRLDTMDLPLRVYYRGDVIRYHEERLGQMREFYQVGAELLGAEERSSDVEILRFFLRFLRFSKSRPVRVVMSFAGALDHFLLRAGSDAGALARAFELRNRESSAGGDVLRDVIEKGEPRHPEELGPGAADRFVRLLATREQLREEFPDVDLSIDLAEFATYTLDPELRGLRGDRGYYDGLIFRGFVGRQNLPVGGGGRYGELFEVLGARVSAIGFAIGLERLMSGASAAEESAVEVTSP